MGKHPVKVFPDVGRCGGEAFPDMGKCGAEEFPDVGRRSAEAFPNAVVRQCLITTFG